MKQTRWWFQPTYSYLSMMVIFLVI
jgi:hypothetical protein